MLNLFPVCVFILEKNTLIYLYEEAVVRCESASLENLYVNKLLAVNRQKTDVY